MAVTIIGSARMGENNSITGGKAGDQKQTKTPDYTGEVSMQNFYIHAKGWRVLRPKSVVHANKIAERMVALCNNPNYGYDQTGRLDVINRGIDSKVKGECDCSSSVRACVKEATGKDAGNFTTANEATMLLATGLFDEVVYVAGMKLYPGDVLVTKTKGHTVIVCYSPYSRASVSQTTSGKTNTSSATKKSNKISEDGEWGTATTKAAQTVFKTTVDGKVSKQIAKYKKYVPACSTSSWQFLESNYKGGSELIKAIQKWVGVSQDGLCGQTTIKYLQEKIGVTADGYMGNVTVTVFQKYLNKNL